MEIKITDLKKDNMINMISKNLIDGEEVSLIGHLL